MLVKHPQNEGGVKGEPLVPLKKLKKGESVKERYKCQAQRESQKPKVKVKVKSEKPKVKNRK
jgi:hypothetical protein